MYGLHCDSSRTMEASSDSVACAASALPVSERDINEAEFPPALTALDYARCYCEENVWMLARRLMCLRPASRLSAMFIFNESGAIPLAAQRAGLGPDRSVVWDYHVVLLEERDLGSTLVWDLDSTLPLPSSLSEYARRTFDPEADDTSLPFHRLLFRLIPAALFFRCFASDRRHMRDGAANYLSPPPSWPLIQQGGCPHTLCHFLTTPSQLRSSLLLPPPTSAAYAPQPGAELVSHVAQVRVLTLAELLVGGSLCA